MEPARRAESPSERPGPEPAKSAGEAAPERRPKSRLRTALTALGVLALTSGAGAVVVLRVRAAGEEELVRSTVALQAKRPHEALVHARRAAGHYVPGAPHVRVARERLRALALAAEKKGDLELALASWRALHTSTHETRWLGAAPGDDEPTRQIARLATRGARPLGQRTTDDAEIERRQLAALTRDEAPSKTLGLALGLGLLAWAAGVPRLARALGANGATRGVARAKLLAPLVLTLGGLAAVLVGVLRA